MARRFVKRMVREAVVIPKVAEVVSRGRARLCSYFECDEAVPKNHRFCRTHYAENRNGLIDECRGCQRAKYKKWPLCRDCNNAGKGKPRAKSQPTARQSKYEPEYNSTWERGDDGIDVFYSYILRLKGGRYYAGHTNDLRLRLMEHRSGKGAKATSGQNPKLVWFCEHSTRREAAEDEADLKQEIDDNPRAVHRLVRNFRDLVDELDFEGL